MDSMAACDRCESAYCWCKHISKQSACTAGMAETQPRIDLEGPLPKENSSPGCSGCQVHCIGWQFVPGPRSPQEGKVGPPGQPAKPEWLGAPRIHYSVMLLYGHEGSGAYPQYTHTGKGCRACWRGPGNCLVMRVLELTPSTLLEGRAAGPAGGALGPGWLWGTLAACCPCRTPPPQGLAAPGAGPSLHSLMVSAPEHAWL